MTREEKRALNKAAHAVARRELIVRSRTIPDDYVEPKNLPDEVVRRTELKRRRGAISDETAVNAVCDLVARGMTESKARDTIGICSTQWGDWRRTNYHGAADKLAFAKKLWIDRKADEIIDIIDDPELLSVPDYDQNGNPMAATVRDKIALAVARCAQRRSVVSVLSPEHMPKNAELRITRNETLSPEEAAKKYYDVLEASPHRVDE